MGVRFKYTSQSRFNQTPYGRITKTKTPIQTGWIRNNPQYERRYSSTWFRNQSHWSKLMVERTSQQSTIILEIYWNIYWEYLEITELRVPTFNIILLMIERNNLFLMVTSYLPYTYLGGIKWVSVLNTPHNQDSIRHPMEGLQKQRHRYKLAE